MSFSSLERDIDYVETNHDADDEFMVYPSQMIVPAGGKQTIRVTWLGTVKPSQELAFRIKVQEVPIELLDHTAPAAPVGKVRVTLAYNGTILIRPPRAAPRIAPETAGLAHDSAGHDALAITLWNEGNAVGLVRSCSLHIVAPDRTAIELSGSAVASLTNARVFANSRRRFLVAWPPGAEAWSREGHGAMCRHALVCVVALALPGAASATPGDSAEYERVFAKPAHPERAPLELTIDGQKLGVIVVELSGPGAEPIVPTVRLAAELMPRVRHSGRSRLAEEGDFSHRPVCDRRRR